MGRIKITGYYTPDDENDLDPDHPTGLTEEGFDRLQEEFIGLEDIETAAE